MKTQVIVIGGGLSGMSAAKLFAEHEIDVIVLEASNRIGGRLHTIYNDKVGHVDVGGAYVGPTQDRVLRLAQELGVKTKPVYCRNDMICYRKGIIKRFQGVLPPMGSVTAMLDSNHLLRTLHSLCDQVSLDEPWTTPGAEYLDRMSFQEFINNTVSSDSVKEQARMNARLNMTAEPYELSLLWMLWYIKSAGGIYRMNAFEGGAQESTFVGGSQQLPIKIAQSIPNKVLMNKPVCRIRQDNNRVIVETVDGEIFEAQYVILATPPVTQLRIIFEPKLPTMRNQLLQRVPHGSVIKTIMFYDKPYWRLNGMCGTMFIEDDNPEFPVVSTIDDTKSDGSRPSIMGFVCAEKARLMSGMSKEERRDSIAKQYATMFNCDEMALPVHYEEKNWCEDPWSGGCYTGYMSPGVMTSFGRAMREPIGRIHFAGTETATVWSGYMDGAIQAGERATKEILMKMRKWSEEDVLAEEPDCSEDFLYAREFRPSFTQKYLPSTSRFKQSIAAIAGVTAVGVVVKQLVSSKL